MKSLHKIILIPLLMPFVLGCTPKQPPLEFSSVHFYSDSLASAGMDSLHVIHESDEVNFEINLMLLQEYEQFPALHDINSVIMQTAFAFSYGDDAGFSVQRVDSAQGVIGEYCAAVRETYRTVDDEMQNDLMYEPMPWNISIKANPVLNEKEVLTYQVVREQFMGSANSETYTYYLAFDPVSGHRFDISDLFVWDEQTRLALAQLVWQGIETMCATHGEYALDDFTFHPDASFHPTNFSINTETLTFYFNVYEIASSAVGPVAIEIPSYQFFEYLEPHAALYKYWFKK